MRLTQNKCIIFDFQKRLSFGNEGKNATQNRPISIFYLQNFPTSQGAHPPQTPPAVLVGSIVEDIILSANLGLVGKFLTATPPHEKRSEDAPASTTINSNFYALKATLK